MFDKEFLQWLYDRLVNEYGIDPQTDYMSKLKAIIEATDPEQLTPNVS